MKRKFRIRFSIILVVIILPAQLLFSSNLDEKPVIKIHYLGHSSFVLQFDNGITLVTDYGNLNAWFDSGWDSPIYSMNYLVPDIMTFSHLHEDHYNPDRVPDSVCYILTEIDSLTIDGIEIKPVRTCEVNINNESNSSYIFKYKGLTLCHLGDAQAQIMNIQNENVKNRIEKIIPDSLDLLFMTIEGTEQFVEEAEMFLDLLKPKRIIPMHYWSYLYKRSFLLYLMTQNLFGTNYYIKDLDRPDYEIYESESVEPVRVISLKPSEFILQTTNINETLKPSSFNLSNNYPNPFNPTTNISYSIPHQTEVKIKIFDVLGNEIFTLVDEIKPTGNYETTFKAGGLSSGAYFYQLSCEEFTQTEKMMLVR